MRKAFDHIGIPTNEPHPGESWVEFSQVWVTNPRSHPQRIEYIRPKDPPDVSPENVGLWKLWHWPHVAYRVEDLRAALDGEEVIFRPLDPGGFGVVTVVLQVGVDIDDLRAALDGEEVIFGPFDPGGFGEVAFVLKDGVVVEYMQYATMDHWFGQPNPPGWKPEVFP